MTEFLDRWDGDIVRALRYQDDELCELAANKIEELRAALEHAAHELELLYFFAISNGISKEGIPPHVQARAALEGK